MALLDLVQKGKRLRPVFICVFGVPGVGKSSFAASAPTALIWCIERGADQLDVAKLPAPASWDAFKSDLRNLQTELPKSPYKTLAIDTLDALENIAIADVCSKGGKRTLADFSWGGGYHLLAQEWRIFLSALEAIRDAGVHIVLIAHEHRKAFADPELGSFEMYRPKLQDKVWGLTNETCDAVLFAQFEAGLLEKDGQRARAIVSGRRVLRTQRGTGFFAKNRYGLPETIDLSWDAFESMARIKSFDELRVELTELLERVDEDTRGKVAAYLSQHGETEQNVRTCVNRLTEILAEKKADIAASAA